MIALTNLGALVGLLLCYIAPYVDPEDFSYLSIFDVTHQFWIALNIGLVLFWLLVKSRLWKYNLLLLILGIFLIPRSFQFGNKPHVQLDSSSLKLGVFNTRIQEIYRTGNTTPLINEYIAGERMDVVGLIEWLNNKGEIDKSVYPYQRFVRLPGTPNDGKFGMMFVSKYKIVGYQAVQYDFKSYNMAAYFDVEIEQKIIRFFLVHLESNAISSVDYRKALELKFSDAGKAHAKNIATKITTAAKKRSEQVKNIRELIDQSPYPVIVMGDFNDTSFGFSYEQLMKGKKDCFVEKGKGIGATFRKPFPFLKIDHILVDEEFEILDFQITDKIPSDHNFLSTVIRY